MKKQFCNILAVAILLILTFTFCSCSSNNKIDIATYFDNAVTVSIYGESKTSTSHINSFSGEEAYTLNRYKYITLSANPKWTYGLTIKTITFNVISDIDAKLDFSATITYLKSADNYDETGEFFYYKKAFEATCKANKECQITLPINGEFTNGNAQISISIDDSCLENTDLFYTIADFTIYGEHTPANY